VVADSRSLPPYITAKGRDLRLDLLRGYFVFAMVIDHVCGSSPLQILSGGNQFFTSAAEGFILTSGLVAGLVYGRLIKRDGLPHSLMKMLTRALKLYLLTVGMTLVFMPLSEWLRLPWAQGLGGQTPLSIIVGVLTLHRTYFMADVMLVYTLLFLAAPLALLLIDQGKRWWVLGGSWALWALFQLWPASAIVPWPIANNSVFVFSAWQVIFFTGLVFGYGRTAMPVLKPRTARRLFAVAGAAMLALIALFLAVRAPAPQSAAGFDLRNLVRTLFLDKPNVRPGRLLAEGITFSFLFLAVTAFWQPLRRALGWLLLPLGQNSLYAYAAHLSLIVLAALALAPLNHNGGAPQWVNALVQIGSVAVLWVLVRYKVLAPTPRTQRAYNLSPIALTALAGLAFFLIQSPVQLWPGSGPSAAAPAGAPAVAAAADLRPAAPALALAPDLTRAPDLAAAPDLLSGVPIPAEPSQPGASG